MRANRPEPGDSWGHWVQHIKIFLNSNVRISSTVDLKIFPMLILWENARPIFSKFRIFPEWWLYPAGRPPALPQTLKVSRNSMRQFSRAAKCPNLRQLRRSGPEDEQLRMIFKENHNSIE